MQNLMYKTSRNLSAQRVLESTVVHLFAYTHLLGVYWGWKPAKHKLSVSSCWECFCGLLLNDLLAFYTLSEGLPMTLLLCRYSQFQAILTWMRKLGISKYPLLQESFKTWSHANNHNTVHPYVIPNPYADILFTVLKVFWSQIIV